MNAAEESRERAVSSRKTASSRKRPRDVHRFPCELCIRDRNEEGKLMQAGR
jgi:hypothetical protein